MPGTRRHCGSWSPAFPSSSSPQPSSLLMVSRASFASSGERALLLFASLLRCPVPKQHPGVDFCRIVAASKTFAFLREALDHLQLRQEASLLLVSDEGSSASFSGSPSHRTAKDVCGHWIPFVLQINGAHLSLSLFFYFLFLLCRRFFAMVYYAVLSFACLFVFAF